MKNQTKIIIAIVAIVVVLFIVSGSYAAYYFLIKDKNTDQSESITDKVGIKKGSSVKEPEKITAEQKEEEEVKEETTNKKVDNEAVDSDEEDNIVSEKDSDKDGLSDQDEKEIYKTNPNKADTDDDGHSDYIEVKSGYDPLKKPGEEKEEVSNNDSTEEASQAYSDPSNKMYVFFMHQSTGEIYWKGGLEEALSNHNYEGYAPSWDNVVNPEDFYGEFTDEDKWNIITKEKMPEGETRDIVLFKSCFPASNITSDDMLENYKTNYKKLYAIYTAHPDILFVPMSTPPLLQVNTTAEAANRAQDFEDWLTKDYVTDYENYSKNDLSFDNRDYNIGGFRIPKGLFSFTKKNKKISDAIAQSTKIGSNLAPFALHSLLSDSNGYLASAYQSDPSDDHPNNKSGEAVGEAMWKHLNEAIVKYK